MIDMKLSLAPGERDLLIDQLCQWANRWSIGTLVAFAAETMRPTAPLTGNFLIAVAPVFGPLSPVSLHDLGLLVQEQDFALRFRQRLEQLANPASPPSSPQAGE